MSRQFTVEAASYCQISRYCQISVMASYQEDQSVNFYGSGIADMNKDDEGEIDITTEVRYFDFSMRSTRASNFTFR